MAVSRNFLSNWLPLAISTIAALLGPAVVADAGQETAAHEVEVAFIFNFVKFVEWPPRAFSSAEAPFTICAVGSDPVVDGLRSLQGRPASQRTVHVQTILRPEDAQSCQILFLSETAEDRFTDFFNTVRGRSVLTVGDTSGFAERGGMIGFFLESNKVRFAINAENARPIGFGREFQTSRGGTPGAGPVRRI